MNTHVKITQSEPADLSRRSFLVGSAATGLVLGYSAVPGMLGADQALAAPSNFDPSVWYSIAPDGIVTVTCGKADMGQHIASTMAQIVCRRARRELEGHAGSARLQRSEVQRPRARRADHRRQLEHDDELRCDEPRGRRGAHRVDGSRGRRDGRAGQANWWSRNSVVSHPKSKKSMTLCRHRQERQDHQDLHAGRTQGDQAQDARPVHHDRRLGAAARYSLEDQRHGQIRHRRHAAGHGLRQGRHAAGALRRHGQSRSTTARRRRCRASSRPSRSTTRPATHDRLGGGGGQHLRQRPQGGGRAEDQL